MHCSSVLLSPKSLHLERQVPCRYDVVVALDSDIKSDIIEMVQPEWHSYYDAKVCMLDQFSDYLGSDILRTGGTAVLESELSGIIKPVIQESKTIPDLLRPSLHKGTRGSTPTVVQKSVECSLHWLLTGRPLSALCRALSTTNTLFTVLEIAQVTRLVHRGSANCTAGAEEWNPMVQAMIISCAGLVQYLVDEYPSDLPHYDPL